MLYLAELKADFEFRRMNRLFDKGRASDFPKVVAQLQHRIRLYDVYIEYIENKLQILKLEL